MCTWVFLWGVVFKIHEFTTKLENLHLGRCIDFWFSSLAWKELGTNGFGKVGARFGHGVFILENFTDSQPLIPSSLRGVIWVDVNAPEIICLKSFRWNWLALDSYCPKPIPRLPVIQKSDHLCLIFKNNIQQTPQHRNISKKIHWFLNKCRFCGLQASVGATPRPETKSVPHEFSHHFGRAGSQPKHPSLRRPHVATVMNGPWMSSPSDPGVVDLHGLVKSHLDVWLV